MIENKLPPRSELVVEDAYNSDFYVAIRINMTKPIEPEVFGGMLKSAALDYRWFLKSTHPDRSDVGVLIRDIREGSILIELIQTLTPIVFADEHARLATGFVQFYKKCLSPYLTTRGRAENVLGSDLERFRETVRFVASLQNGEQSFEAVHKEKDGTRTIMEKFTISATQAPKMQERIQHHINDLKSSSLDQKKLEWQLMRFQTIGWDYVGTGKKSKETVIIKSVAEEDFSLIYETKNAENEIKEEIRESHDNLFRKGFLVDVLVETQKGKIVAYRVIKVHKIIDLPGEQIGLNVSF